MLTAYALTTVLKRMPSDPAKFYFQFSCACRRAPYGHASGHSNMRRRDDMTKLYKRYQQLKGVADNSGGGSGGVGPIPDMVRWHTQLYRLSFLNSVPCLALHGPAMNAGVNVWHDKTHGGHPTRRRSAPV